MITVFTPTYNRAYIISQLFESLKKQTCLDFEWLIVDDGSTDNTEELILTFKHDSHFNIRYFKQSNGGKHSAINRGVTEAKGDLFFIVDSDDSLSQNAIEFLSREWYEIKDNQEFVGISGTRVFPNNKKIGSNFPYKSLDCSVIDFRFKYNFKGDMAEAWRTKVLMECPFPKIENEKFLTEALVWNRISKIRKVRFFNEPIYICQYLKGGLTSNITILRMKNPKGCQLYYSEEAALDVSLKHKIKSHINFWRFSLCSRNSLKQSLTVGKLNSLIGLLPGFLMHVKDLVQSFKFKS